MENCIILFKNKEYNMIKTKNTIRKYFKICLKIIFAYALTGGLYLITETIFRHYTFIEMFYLAGCVGLAAMFFNNIFSYDIDYLLQIFIIGSICILGEGLVGNHLNTDYHMWDYRTLPGSMWNDQINIIFMIVWYILVAIIIPILDYIDWKLFDYKKDTPPYYVVLGKKVFQFKK